MKKETIIAILLGIGFGIGVAAMVVSQTKTPEQQKEPKTIETSLNITPTVPVIPEETSASLEISAPTAGAIFSKKEIEIIGKAPKGSKIVVISPAKTEVVVTEDEQFTIDFSLAFGENIISVTAYAPDQVEPVEKTLTVYYLDEK